MVFIPNSFSGLHSVKDKGLLPRAAETLSYLLADEKPKVVKRAVQACNAMLVTAFVECALHPRAHHAKVG